LQNVLPQIKNEPLLPQLYGLREGAENLPALVCHYLHNSSDDPGYEKTLEDLQAFRE
jgi:hypothetical protein